jgi:hypothetical protein
VWEPQPLSAASLGRHVVTVRGLDHTRSLPMCQRLPPCAIILALIKRLFAVFVFANTPLPPFAVKNATNATRGHVTAKSLRKVGLTWALSTLFYLDGQLRLDAFAASLCFCFRFHRLGIVCRAAQTQGMAVSTLVSPEGSNQATVLFSHTPSLSLNLITTLASRSP